MSHPRAELINMAVKLHYAFECVEDLGEALEPAIDITIAERDFVTETLLKEVRESQRAFIREVRPLRTSLRMRFFDP